MPAIVTPFTEAGEVDLDAHRHNLAALSDRGVKGFLLAGSTGEGPYLDSGERASLVETARKALPDAYLLCGVAAESVRQGIAQVKEAVHGGADAVLVMTPTTLVRARPVAIGTFFRCIDEASEIPVMLYSVPKVTALELSVDDAVALTARPNVVGMKDSGGHPIRAQQIVAGSPEPFWFFAGASGAISLSIAAGGFGAITASANYAPSLVRDAVDAARKGVDKAAEVQERLAGLSKLVDSRGVPGVKLAAQIAGLQPGVPRLPLRPLNDDEASTLRRQLEALKGQLLG
jgi:dihydrodipicolinate synthase/N-acetylneuraminate lyase